MTHGRAQRAISGLRLDSNLYYRLRNGKVFLNLVNFMASKLVTPRDSNSKILFQENLPLLFDRISVRMSE